MVSPLCLFRDPKDSGVHFVGSALADAFPRPHGWNRLAVTAFPGTFVGSALADAFRWLRGRSRFAATTVPRTRPPRRTLRKLRIILSILTFCVATAGNSYAQTLGAESVNAA